MPREANAIERAAASGKGLAPRAHSIRVRGFRDLQVGRALRYWIKWIFPGHCLALVYGESGSGKTFFVGHAALCAGSGRDFLGRKTSPGLVVYVAAEGPASAELRFAGQRQELHIEDARLILVDGEINLLDGAFIDALLAKLEELDEELGPIAAIVIDTVAQASPGGDENAPETMGLIVNAGQRIRDRFRCCVVLVHHAGKDKGRGARGHSSLRAAADVEIEIVETHGQRVARVTKSRDGESGAEIAFSLRQIVIGKDEDGDDITTCVVEPSREAPNAKGSTAKLPPAASIALDALREVGGTKGRRSTETSTTPAGKTIVNLDDWRDQFRLRYGTDGQDGEAIKKAFQRARERLAGDKVIGVSGSVAWLW